MPDMLVRLWKLDYSEFRRKEANIAKTTGIRFLRVLSPNFKKVEAFIKNEFSEGWASETTASFYNDPISCFIAVDAKNEILGFACYNATGKSFFGPTGVVKKMRGQGIGSVLLWRCLESLWEQGFAYAIIGAVGPADYYAKAVGATVIEDSSPGIYCRCV